MAYLNPFSKHIVHSPFSDCVSNLFNICKPYCLPVHWVPFLDFAGCLIKINSKVFRKGNRYLQSWINKPNTVFNMGSSFRAFQIVQKRTTILHTFSSSLLLDNRANQDPIYSIHRSTTGPITSSIITCHKNMKNGLWIKQIHKVSKTKYYQQLQIHKIRTYSTTTRPIQIKSSVHWNQYT